MKALLAFIIFCLYSLTSWSFTVATFNLQFYGLGGHLAGYLKIDEKGKQIAYDEYRDYHIKSFIKKEVPDYDVIFFQEVVTKNRLLEMSIIDPKVYDCHSYENPRHKKHQHVVACLKKTLDFDLELIEEVQINRYGLRPALVLKLKDPKTGKYKLNLVGVHLKNPRDIEGAKQARDQMEALGRWFEKNKNVPSLFIGDFNQNSGDDVIYMMGQEGKGSIISLEPPTHTHTSRWSPDRAFLSKSLKTESVKIGSFSGCGKLRGKRGQSRYYNRSFYRRFVSDHCPYWVQIPDL